MSPGAVRPPRPTPSDAAGYNEDTNTQRKPFVLLVSWRALARLIQQPTDGSPTRLRCRNDIERRRNGASVAAVTHPQFGTRELPLSIRIVLQLARKIKKK